METAWASGIYDDSTGFAIPQTRDCETKRTTSKFSLHAWDHPPPRLRWVKRPEHRPHTQKRAEMFERSIESVKVRQVEWKSREDESSPHRRARCVSFTPAPRLNQISKHGSAGPSEGLQSLLVFQRTYSLHSRMRISSAPAPFICTQVHFCLLPFADIFLAHYWSW